MRLPVQISASPAEKPLLVVIIPRDQTQGRPSSETGQIKAIDFHLAHPPQTAPLPQQSSPVAGKTGSPKSQSPEGGTVSALKCL